MLFLAKEFDWNDNEKQIRETYLRARKKAAKLQAAQAAAGAANPIAAATTSTMAVAANTEQVRPAAAPIPAPAAVTAASAPISVAAPAPIPMAAPVVASRKPVTPVPVSAVAVLRTGESFTWKGKDGKERRYKVKFGPITDDPVIDAEALDVAALPRGQRVWVRYKRDPRLAIPVERFFALPTDKVNKHAMRNHRMVVAHSQALTELHKRFGDQHDWWLPLDKNNSKHTGLFDFSIPMGKEYQELGGLILATVNSFTNRF